MVTMQHDHTVGSNNVLNKNVLKRPQGGTEQTESSPRSKTAAFLKQIHIVVSIFNKWKRQIRGKVSNVR